MFHKIIKFIHNLRILFFVGIVVLTLAVIGANPVDLTRYIGAGMSDASMVGSSASVPVNPMNTLALQLKEKENSLNERENELSEMEANILARQNKFIWIMFSGIGVLFLLIIINYILDIKRRKDEKMRPNTELKFKY